MSKSVFFRSNLCYPILTGTSIRLQSFGRKPQIYSEGKLKPLDLKTYVFRNFEAVVEKLVKYLNAISMK